MNLYYIEKASNFRRIAHEYILLDDVHAYVEQEKDYYDEVTAKLLHSYDTSQTNREIWENFASSFGEAGQIDQGCIQETLARFSQPKYVSLPGP